jgi:hypothetical protein
VNNAWEELGYAYRDQCVQQIFTNRCDVQSGQHGEMQLRRYRNKIEGREPSVSDRWQALANSNCPNRR